MDADLDTLLIALYVELDDRIIAAHRPGPRRGLGRPPLVNDAELVCLAVAQVLLRYVAVRITGSVPANLVMLIFDYVPGCDRGGWFPEDALPDRRLRPGEQTWPNLMDPAAAAKLLDPD